jgi:hypothetical protein
MIFEILLIACVFTPFLMLLEAKRSIRRYIFSGKLFFGDSHEIRMKPRTLWFLACWLASLPLSIIALIVLLLRWS